MLVEIYLGLVSILVIVALVWIGNVDQTLQALRREVATLRRQTNPEQPGREAVEPSSSTPIRDRIETEPITPPSAEHSLAPAHAYDNEDRDSANAPPPTPAIAQRQHDVEVSLTGRWTIWLGAAILALGAAFLVKYSVDQGWLGPAIRIALATVLGLALIALGHAARIEELRRKIPLATPTYTAPALTGAGIATLFVAFYAAFALYALIPSLAAFGLMSGVAALAVLLSLLHGSFIALLGFAGAFLIPLLIPSKNPSAWGLFGYLIIISAGSLMLVRYRAWWWLAQVCLTLSALWTIVWMIFSWHNGDEAIVGGYLTLLAAGFLFLTRDRGVTAPVIGRHSSHAVHVWASAATTSALMAAMVTLPAGEAPAALLAAGVLAAFFLIAGRWDAGFDRLAWVAAGLVIVIIAAWHFTMPPYVNQREASLVVQPWIPLGADRFITASISFAALLGAGGYWLQWGATRPWCWAAAAVVAPIVVLAAVYWRIAATASLMPWGALGLALSALYLAAAWQTEKQREQAGMEAALAAYAIGVVASLSLAATMILKEAWLSVALATQLPATAWIAAQTRVAALRRVATVLAGIVLVRLLLNLSILDYPLAANPVVNWLLYGYGLPAISFFVAARLFRRDADDLLVILLESGGIALGLALVTLDIHQLFGDGTLKSRNYGIAEQSLQASSWLIAALLLIYCARAGRRPVFVYGWKIIAAAAGLHFLFFQLTTSNPLFTQEPVGEHPIFNLLLVAYGLPAALAIPLACEARRQDEWWPALTAQISALILAFVVISLEIRQAFHGSILSGGGMSDAEAYCYSLAWLLDGSAVLGIGIYRRLAVLRLSGLAIITLTVAKAFLFDMANLTGLYRAASFLALGLSLIGIGYLYQRIVFPPEKRMPHSS